MHKRAAQDLDLDLGRSYIVGDNVSDLIPGEKLGCQTVLVRTGYGQSLLDKGAFEDVCVDHIADALGDAADWILAQLDTE
jgi:D-glycero-D-manno-heptose 1,7-bisphosphate phosphatase